MKKNDIYDALTGIDEKFLLESENSQRISADFRSSRRRNLRAFGAFATFGGSIAAALGMIFVLAGTSLNTTPYDNPDLDAPAVHATETAEASESKGNNITISTSASDRIIATESIDSIEEQIEKIDEIKASGNDKNDGKSNDKATENDSIVNDKNEEKTDEKITPPKPPVSVNAPVIPAEVDSDGLGDLSLEHWLNMPDIVWSEDGSKGIGTQSAPMGNAVISDTLERLMEFHGNGVYYAVAVDFSSCFDTDEMQSWECDGETIAELLEQLNSSNNDREAAMEIKRMIGEIRCNYFTIMRETFANTFRENGLSIYTLEWMENSPYFCTFGSKESFENFSCRENEAFVFYPCSEIK